MQVHKALKLTRKFHRLTQEELAVKLGISKSYLSQIESEKRTVSLELLEKYQQEFGIPVSNLLLFSEALENNSRLEKGRVKVARKLLRIASWLFGEDQEGGHMEKHHNEIQSKPAILKNHPVT